jgi:ribosomal protein S10
MLSELGEGVYWDEVSESLFWLDIHNSNNKTVDSLSKLEIPAGVDIEIKL